MQGADCACVMQLAYAHIPSKTSCCVNKSGKGPWTPARGIIHNWHRSYKIPCSCTKRFICSCMPFPGTRPVPCRTVHHLQRCKEMLPCSKVLLTWVERQTNSVAGSTRWWRNDNTTLPSKMWRNAIIYTLKQNTSHKGKLTYSVVDSTEILTLHLLQSSEILPHTPCINNSSHCTQWRRLTNTYYYSSCRVAAQLKTYDMYNTRYLCKWTKESIIIPHVTILLEPADHAHTLCCIVCSLLAHNSTHSVRHTNLHEWHLYTCTAPACYQNWKQCQPRFGLGRSYICACMHIHPNMVMHRTVLNYHMLHGVWCHEVTEVHYVIELALWAGDCIPLQSCSINC